MSTHGDIIILSRRSNSLCLRLYESAEQTNNSPCSVDFVRVRLEYVLTAHTSEKKSSTQLRRISHLIKMKASTFVWSLLATTISPALGLDSHDAAINKVNKVLERREESQENAKITDSSSTKFNGVQVPAMKEIQGMDFEESIKEGYWYALF